MSTNFPASLDTLTNPAPLDGLTGHASQHANVNDAIEAIEAKVGANGSADPSSIDYRIAALESGSGGGSWGSITGTLSDQADLQAALNGKLSTGSTTDSVAEGVTNQYFTAQRVRDAVLTGLSTATNALITATDTVLGALGKLQKQISDNLTALNLKAPIASPTFTGTVTAPKNFNVTDAYGALQVGGVDVLRFGSDTSGQLAGFRNILINGDMRLNQRNVNIAAAANGTYGPDRWKKVDASNMTQIIEAGNFEPSTTYTLSGTGVTTKQITSPASGNWTLPNIPISATKIQLEKGSIATPFENRPIGLELALCQRYYEAGIYSFGGNVWAAAATWCDWVPFKTSKRTAPTVTATGGASTNVTSANRDAITADGFRLVVTATAQGAWGYTGVSFNADAEL